MTKSVKVIFISFLTGGSSFHHRFANSISIFFQRFLFSETSALAFFILFQLLCLRNFIIIGI